MIIVPEYLPKAIPYKLVDHVCRYGNKNVSQSYDVYINGVCIGSVNRIGNRRSSQWVYLFGNDQGYARPTRAKSTFDLLLKYYYPKNVFYSPYNEQFCVE